MTKLTYREQTAEQVIGDDQVDVDALQCWSPVTLILQVEQRKIQDAKQDFVDEFYDVFFYCFIRSHPNHHNKVRQLNACDYDEFYAYID